VAVVDRNLKGEENLSCYQTLENRFPLQPNIIYLVADVPYYNSSALCAQLPPEPEYAQRISHI
jgi:hypothetical protein